MLSDDAVEEIFGCIGIGSGELGTVVRVDTLPPWEYIFVFVVFEVIVSKVQILLIGVVGRHEGFKALHLFCGDSIFLFTEIIRSLIDDGIAGRIEIDISSDYAEYAERNMNIKGGEFIIAIVFHVGGHLLDGHNGNGEKIADRTGKVHLIVRFIDDGFVNKRGIIVVDGDRRGGIVGGFGRLDDFAENGFAGCHVLDVDDIA